MALRVNGQLVGGVNIIPSYTQAQYDALEVKPEFWICTDKEYLSVPADKVTYNNSESGLEATDLQDAIDEVVGVAVKIGKIFDTEKCKGILSIAGNTAMLFCTVTSGTGISQYTSLLYQQIPSAYRPSSAIRATANMSSDLGTYNFQILNSGSLQNLAAIPADITTTIMATWNFS